MGKAMHAGDREYMENLCTFPSISCERKTAFKKQSLNMGEGAHNSSEKL